jgi:hypothetical protein
MRGLDDDRRLDAEFLQLREHAHAVELRHHEIEDGDIDARAVGRTQQRQGFLAALQHERLVTERRTIASRSRRCTGSSSTIRIVLDM